MAELNIQDVERIALRAGKLIMEYFNPRSGIDFDRKADNSPVTKADMASQKYLDEALSALTPGIPVLGEELSADEVHVRTRGNEPEKFWIVDPLDGTHNFASGIDVFCVSICFVDRGLPLLGVIYDPVRKDMYSAVAGGGAFRNGTRVSANGAKDLKNYVISVHLRRLSPAMREFVTGSLADTVERIREIGSLALKMAWIACGKHDGNIQGRVNFWDSSAGILLLQEAGGICSDFLGGALTLSPHGRHDLLASANTHLHSWLLREIRKYLERT